MKKWRKSSKILFWFIIAIIAFIIIRLLLAPEFAVAIAAIPGFLFVGYMANLGAQMMRNPGPAPMSKESDEDE